MLHLLVSVLLVKTLSFCGLLSSTHSAFCAFCWWFHWLKWCPGVVVKWHLLFLSIRKLWCVLWRKDMYQIAFIQAWVMGTVHHEIKVNESMICIILGVLPYLIQRYTWNKVMFCPINDLWWPDAHRNLTLYLIIVLANSVFGVVV